MKIYFDMDGVLVNFDTNAAGGANLNHPSETLSPELKALKTQFWQKIEQNKNFWHDIPVMPRITELLSTAKQYSELFVLSKTPGAHHFVSGQTYVDFVANEKRNWIAEHLSEFFDANHVIICDGAKGKLIHPTKDDILVDDRKENIDEWISQGGTGVLFKNAIDAKNLLIETINHK